MIIMKVRESWAIKTEIFVRENLVILCSTALANLEKNSFT